LQDIKPNNLCKCGHLDESHGRIYLNYAAVLNPMYTTCYICEDMHQFFQADNLTFVEVLAKKRKLV
jgi:hypothetical protein